MRQTPKTCCRKPFERVQVDRPLEGRSSLSTWLYRIASNAALMRLRRHEPEQVSVDEPVERDDGEMMPRQFFDFCCLPEDDLLREEAREQMKQAIDELPPTTAQRVRSARH